VITPLGATDPGGLFDCRAWIKRTGHRLGRSHSSIKNTAILTLTMKVRSFRDVANTMNDRV
jgi:hypothetical protein